ncbi:Stk1 family PASTA domain-containing Ser/Thr kinase [Alkalicoccus luteus]|uniref:Serine/threonine-protein kinase PrkC n=1 Tax=Alkalicoccus luteus TaxID=1237094 RepID=A0A969PP65_9BACI|nr:Stk1 family PASTA domain-containing Ser/Thr kinase [Alkalicoccus luteus]NJP36404.1 Stk1 family PASTA domain-containing Ser/Thr kinase [Alkalicoccus luteus]
MIGRRINERYKLIRPIGGGGMADVYLAKDLILDRHVAVKMLKSQFSKNEEFIRRFHREAEAATSLSHENIVSIYDVGEENDLYYIVMEYVEGQTLKEYIQSSGVLTVEETVRILKQIAEAVKHAHDNQIVHRDVKPQNILMSVNGQAKVTDFGIARAISEATITHTNSILGSVHYLSPEQARGGQVTYKSDLYSLGIIAYEMLTGSVPFKGDTAVTIALKHLQEPLPELRTSAVPNSVKNMITRLTAKKPIDRFSGAGALLENLHTVLDPSRRSERLLEWSTEEEEETKKMPAVFPAGRGSDPETIVHTKAGAAGEHEQTPAKPSKKKKWLLPVMIAVLLTLSAFIWLPGLLHVDEVAVPDLAGQHADAAAEQLESLDLEVERAYRESSDTADNHVISVQPDEGTNVKVGSTVRLVISENDASLEVPDVTGLSEEEAQSQLEAFDEVSVSYETVSEQENGIVLEQEPSAGETVIPSETTVMLNVAEREVVSIGNLFGMTEEEVTESFEGVPYVTVRFTEEYDESMSEGRVIEQDPPRGTEITESTTVMVTLSGGPEPGPAVASAEVPFSVQVPENGNGRSYQIEIQVIDDENDTPAEVIDEEITSSTEFDVPMRVEEGSTGYLILYVDGEEFDASPYEYTFEEVQSYSTDE